MKSKRFIISMFTILVLFGCLYLNTNAAESEDSFLSSLYLTESFSTPPNFFLNVDGKVSNDYTVIIPNDYGEDGFALGGIISSSAPESSKMSVSYMMNMFGSPDIATIDLQPGEENVLFFVIATALGEQLEGNILSVNVGVENNNQIYSIYIQRENTSAANVTTQLNALPEVTALTVSDKEAVTAAKEAYEALTDEQKSYMQPSLIQKLTDVEAKIAELEKAEADQKAADKVINAIKATNPATASKEELKAVQSAYAALTADQKAIVDADPAAVAAKKAIDAKVEELNKPVVTTVPVNKGTAFTVKGYKYKVTSNLVENPTVTVVGYKNKKLTKITVPATVTYKNVVFNVTAIGDKAFKGQKKAKSVVIGKNVNKIGSQAFYGDKKIKKITVKSSTLTKIGSKAFKGIYKKAIIKVPSEKLNEYKKLMKGKGQASRVKIIK